MSNRRNWLIRLAPVALMGLLAAAWLLPVPEWLRLESPDPRAAEGMRAVIDDLPDAPRLLVGFDPDLGTYAEVRPTVRALVDELLAMDAHLDVISLTPEGRALAAAELARLESEGFGAGSVSDLGFVSGAEAALVDLAPAVASRYHAILVIGGNDIGPRSWVEQVLPRAAGVPLLAVTPTVLLPDVQPYVASGQLDAALITPRDGAAFRAGLPTDPGARDLSALGILIGMLVAIGVLGQAVAARAVAELRATRPREVE